MNKKDFTAYISEQLEGMSLAQQIKTLRKIKENYLPELIHKKQKEEGTWVEPSKSEKYILCKGCGKYSLVKACKEEIVTEVRTVSTYRDAAYGEGDMEGDVEYMVRYSVCPRCGHKQEKCKHYIRTLREWLCKEGRK